MKKNQNNVKIDRNVCKTCEDGKICIGNVKDVKISKDYWCEKCIRN